MAPLQQLGYIGMPPGLAFAEPLFVAEQRKR